MKKIIFATLFILSTPVFASSNLQPEKILGYLPTSTGIVFQVTSGGCTRHDDFVAQVRRIRSTGVLQLLLMRTHPDLCYAYIPTGVRLEMTYEELGMTRGESFVLMNQNGVVNNSSWGSVSQ